MQQSIYYPWYVKIIFWLQKRNYGVILNSALIWAKSPIVFLGLSWLYASLERKKSPIAPVLRTLIIVRVSQINGCAFCIDLNTSVLCKRGVSLEKAQALTYWKQSELFSDLEKLVLEYTEVVTDSNQKISEALKHQIQSYFSEEEIVEITALIAFQNMSTKFNNAFGVAPQGFCGIDSH